MKLIIIEGVPTQQSTNDSWTMVSSEVSPRDDMRNFIARLAICVASDTTFPPPRGVCNQRRKSFPIPVWREKLGIWCVRVLTRLRGNPSASRLGIIGAFSKKKNHGWRPLTCFLTPRWLLKGLCRQVATGHKYWLFSSTVACSMRFFGNAPGTLLQSRSRERFAILP